MCRKFDKRTEQRTIEQAAQGKAGSEVKGGHTEQGEV